MPPRELHPALFAVLASRVRFAAAWLGWLLPLTFAFAGPDNTARAFRIPAGPASETLKQFAEQAQREILVPSDSVVDVRTLRVFGDYPPREALDRLLAGTRLRALETPDTGGFVISPATSGPAVAGDAPLSPIPMKTKSRPLLSLFASLMTALGADTNAQTSPALAKLAKEEAVVLSPFVIISDKDVGYQAENTLAGSRLNSKLRDTPGSISVFTREFLDDIGLSDLSELVRYAVNAEMDTLEGQAGSLQNKVVNGERLTSNILIRGLSASQGIDYFTSITPIDPYRIERYEDSRGPNSILFGIGSPGGLVNQSSRIATTRGNTASLRYGFGSWDRSRLELAANRVLKKDRLAVAIAAVEQENGGWRAFDFQDKKHIFGSVTFRPIRTLTLSAMGETGRDKTAVLRTTTESEGVLAWLDNRQAFGVNTVTFVPNNTLPTVAQAALGVTGRDGIRTGNNRRAIFIENDGTVFDAIGTFLTGTYNNSAVRAPDGTPGVTGSSLRINDPSIHPRMINAAGPGMFRAQSAKNYTLTADWQATPNLAFNLAHNFQETEAVVTLMTGSDPILRGEPNRTLGVNGAANPYAGRLYYDGTWRRDVHPGTSRETRLTASYSFDSKSKWFGSHRIAAMVSQSAQVDERATSWLALAGRPFNNVPNNVNNRITVRNYLTEGNYGTYRVGDWRSLPSRVTFGGQSYGLVFANEVAGANNSGGQAESFSKLAVAQSHFWAGKVVTTFGYREDKVDVTEFGFANDTLIGDVVDRDPAKSKGTSATGRTGTAGVVFHLTNQVSVIANRSSNIGVPSFVRKVFPDGNLAPPSKGEGADYGLGFDLFSGRVNAKVVYFTTTEKGRINTNGFNDAAGRNTQVIEALAGVLAGAGRRYTPEQWDPIYKTLTPRASAVASDFDSSGYEARITINLTRQWRFVANYSYTDSALTHFADEMVAWYGLKKIDSVALVQGVRQNAGGQYVVDPSAFVTGGAVAKWIELGASDPAANLSTLTTSNGLTVAQAIFEMTDTLSSDRKEQQKRWGLRPHKVSLFTAYDFTEQHLKGFSVGGGLRWRSTNVIGENSQGGEITGKAITETDLMLAYSYKFSRLPGRVRFQVNVTNLFDRIDIIPVRLSTSAAAPDGYQMPGARGLAYSRFDLVAPREIRFTTTYSF